MGERGQATAEYAAVVLLVVLLLVAAGGVTAARGGGVGDAVVRQVLRALCIATGGDCDREREPCVVSSANRRVDNGATVVVLRFGSDRTVLVERRSDRSVVVTYAEGDLGGLDLEGGAGGRLSVGRF